MKNIRIGKLAELSGFSIDTIRYYEKIGLLEHTQRSGGGYRLYSNEHLRCLHFIAQSKTLGFSIKEIGELLFLQKNRKDKTCYDVKKFALEKLEDINNRISELQNYAVTLKEIIDSCDGSNESAEKCCILKSLDSSICKEKTK